jgi:RimJ/RimL family protein N-acetyltransferase
MSSNNSIKIIPEIAEKRITLRRLRFSDSKDIYHNIKDREVVKWTLNIPHPYSRNEAIKFIRKVNYEARKKKSYVFGIALKDENKIIGVIGLSKINYKDSNAEIGYWLGKKYWGKGIMTEAVKLILELGFKQLKLHKINAGLFEKNIASKKVLEKAGFRFEGKIRESRFRSGGWHDELRYGILYSEYKNKRVAQEWLFCRD